MFVSLRSLSLAGFVAATAGAGLAGCAEKKAEAPPPAAEVKVQAAAAAGDGAPEVLAEAKALFATRCSVCHGPEGKGDGAAAAGLNPQPKNFTDAAWQQSVTDEHIEKIIASGGPAVGKSAAMPANPDLVGKPVVAGLRKLVRQFGGQ